MNPTSWLERLFELLCRIYMAWGDKCEDLGPEPADWISAVNAKYAAKGAPTFPDGAAKNAFLDDLTALEMHLADPANVLSPAQTASLLQLITNLRHDIVPS